MQDKTPLRDFLDLVESQLDRYRMDIATEPLALDDDCSVVSVAPVQGGFVGLDMETGKPVPASWKYKTIHEKPVIINTGNKQTVIPPVSPPDEPLPMIVDSAMAGQLFEDMRAKLKYGAYMTAKDVETKNCFVVGCLSNPSFYTKWRSILDALAPVPEPAAEPAHWPRPPQIRQRIVDT